MTNKLASGILSMMKVKPWADLYKLAQLKIPRGFKAYGCMLLFWKHEYRVPGLFNKERPPMQAMRIRVCLRRLFLPHTER